MAAVREQTIQANGQWFSGSVPIHLEMEKAFRR
jgi:hypothetical protein